MRSASAIWAIPITLMMSSAVLADIALPPEGDPEPEETTYNIGFSWEAIDVTATRTMGYGSDQGIDNSVSTDYEFDVSALDKWAVPTPDPAPPTTPADVSPAQMVAYNEQANVIHAFNTGNTNDNSGNYNQMKNISSSVTSASLAGSNTPMPIMAITDTAQPLATVQYNILGAGTSGAASDAVNTFNFTR